MRIDSLQLFQFRNYKDVTIQFNPEIIVLHGTNGAGKTNILESIYVGTIGKSHRTNDTSDMLMFNAEEAGIVVKFEKKDTPQKVNIKLFRQGPKDIRLNDTKISQKELIGTLNTVIFCPEDLQLIKGAPALRRKFIDIELGQIKPIYLADLSSYNHVLKQRNAYLKANDKVDETFLSVLDEQLIDFGCRVMQHRLDFIEKLEGFAQESHSDISQGKEKLTIKYLSSVPFSRLEDLEASFRSALSESRRRDLFKKNTGVGPHRDDINFFINEMDAGFGSQGQHRSVVLSLKLAEIKLIESLTKDTPILLLDDVMSELDNMRQLKLLETISQNIQTFITTTSLDHLHNLPEDINIFQISQGVIKKEENINFTD